MKNLFTCSLLTVLFLVVYNNGMAQIPIIQSSKTYGGTNDDGMNLFTHTPDGGYIVSGYTYSSDGDVTSNHGDVDFWLLKLNVSGTIEWQKTYGGSGRDYPISVTPGKDGGYVIAGETGSSDGDLVTAHPAGDAWILKVNDTGKIEWSTTVGGSGWDFVNGIDTTSDTCYVVTGGTFSNNGDFSLTQGYSDTWVAKIGAAGGVIWMKEYGGTGGEYAFNIHQTTDHGYIVAGYTTESPAHAQIIKLDDTGKVVWSKRYGGSGNDVATDAIPLRGGGYMMCGTTNSKDGDVASNHGLDDYWLVRLDDTGRIQWEKTYGGSKFDFAGGICETINNDGYVVAGYSGSSNGDVSTNQGLGDGWLIGVDTVGKLLWQKTFGGSKGDSSWGIVANADGSYTVGCVTTSTNGDVIGNHGGEDMWMVKIFPYQVGIKNQEINNVKVYPTLTSGLVQIDMPDGFNNASVRLFDIQGRQVSAFTISGRHTTINIENLPQGAYNLYISSKGLDANYKIIKVD
ncbi:MAG: hypothetical protein BGO70_13625 [Bacteroidetes bacterium 43-93]|nr:T9SS type A sorting domain-containing protein [Bacteroidota bacterium]OJW99475.1 MAG: hypothetical protein BGO70_13625 [Bacteroidetes bacterium 43-93]